MNCNHEVITSTITIESGCMHNIKKKILNQNSVDKENYIKTTILIWTVYYYGLYYEWKQIKFSMCVHILTLYDTIVQVFKMIKKYKFCRNMKIINFFFNI